MPLTNAERQRRHRQKVKARGPLKSEQSEPKSASAAPAGPVDPVRILESICLDEKLPAGARVQAARTLLTIFPPPRPNEAKPAGQNLDLDQRLAAKTIEILSRRTIQ